MRKVWPLLVIGVLTYALFLLARLPAAMLLGPAGQAPGLQLAAPSGTVWQGRFEQARLATVDLGRVQWRVRPSRLLAGRLELELQARPAGGSASGTLQLRPGGRVALVDGRGQLPVTPLAPLFSMPPGSRATKRFAGFRSRWTIPIACASAIASQACSRKSTAVSTGSGPCCSRRSDRSPPSRYSITM
jgi:hypothetical protein